MTGYIAPTSAGFTSQRYGSNPGGYNPAGGHTGEDIALPIGTPLVAMADGVVVHAGRFSGAYWDNPWLIVPDWAGFVVTVDYGGALSHYCHCSGSPVTTGQRVRQGQTVAFSGNTGSATSGPHCHWEVMLNGWNVGNGTYGRTDPRSIITGLAPAGTITKPAASKGFLMALTDAQQADLYNKVNALHRDYSQGIPGKQRDGDSFAVIRSIANKIGVKIDEVTRQKKYGK